MPRIETAKHTYIDENGESQVLKLAYDVNAEGVFMTNLPDWLVENVKAIREADRRWISVLIQRLPKNVRISATQLAPLKQLVEEALRQFSAPVVVTELVIRYYVKTEAAAWELPDGRLAANGREGERLWKASTSAPDSQAVESASSSGCGAWAKELSLHAANCARGGYMVRVGAVAQQKVTTTRGQAVKIEYRRVEQADRRMDPSLERLNGIVGLDMDNSSRSFSDAPRFELREMPYSPEAADFFHSVMLGVAQLALRMERFFGDQASLLANIQKGTPLLGSNRGGQTGTTE